MDLNDLLVDYWIYRVFSLILANLIGEINYAPKISILTALYRLHIAVERFRWLDFMLFRFIQKF